MSGARDSISAGALPVVAGGTLYLAARLHFGSFRLTWGLDTSRLVTTGIYRFSRHPQSLGWILVLTGTGVMGRSTVGLLLAGVYGWTCLVWLPIEEGILEQRFGSEYRRYLAATPWFLGLPRDRG